MAAERSGRDELLQIFEAFFFPRLTSDLLSFP